MASPRPSKAAKAGAHEGPVARDEEALRRVSEEIGADGRAEYFAADVGDERRPATGRLRRRTVRQLRLFPEHGRNLTESEAKLPPPVYSPELVANAIHHAASIRGERSRSAWPVGRRCSTRP